MVQPRGGGPQHVAHAGPLGACFGGEVGNRHVQDVIFVDGTFAGPDFGNNLEKDAALSRMR